jgi:hypothetical protein
VYGKYIEGYRYRTLGTMEHDYRSLRFGRDVVPVCSMVPWFSVFAGLWVLPNTEYKVEPELE